MIQGGEAMRPENAERLTIGEVAQGAGVATTTLRYYEREGLLAPTDRSRAGYRLYDDGAVQRLEFIRAAKAVGFTLDDIRALLELNGDSPCKQVHSLIERRVAEAPIGSGRGKRPLLPAHMRRGRSMGGRNPPSRPWPSGPSADWGAAVQK